MNEYYIIYHEVNVMPVLGLYLLIGLILVMVTVGTYVEYRIDRKYDEKNRR